MRGVKETAIVAAVVIVGIFAFWAISVASASDTLTVSADIQASDSVISIDVPSPLYLGKAQKGGNSNEEPIWINNTGTVAVTVTPELMNSSDNIFSNLFFREYTQSSDPVKNIPVKIGDFSVNVSVSSTSDKRIYIRLNLENYTDPIYFDMNNRTADIRFVAVQK